MTNLRIQSVRAPNNDPRLAAAAVDALIRADAMGLLSQPVTCLDDSALAGHKVGMAEAGIDQTFLAELQRLPCIDPHGLSALLEKISEALDQSPAPAQEWLAMQVVPGPELLTRLTGISQSSAPRELSGTRTTPDTIAAPGFIPGLCRRRSCRHVQRYQRQALVRQSARAFGRQDTRPDASGRMVAGGGRAAPPAGFRHVFMCPGRWPITTLAVSSSHAK